jgi:hypothetical protein
MVSIPMPSLMITPGPDESNPQRVRRGENTQSLACATVRTPSDGPSGHSPEPSSPRRSSEKAGGQNLRGQDTHETLEKPQKNRTKYLSHASPHDLHPMFAPKWGTLCEVA